MDDQRTYRELEELAAMYLRSPDELDEADFTPMTLSQPSFRDGDPAVDRRASTARKTEANSPSLRLAGNRPPRVEAVFVGNLPGFASAWLTQYADELSASLGPVAIAHVEPGLVELELLEPNPDRQPADKVKSSVSGGHGPSELESTLEALAEQVNAWLIHLRQPASGGAADVLAMADCWTLISGADQPAVVAGYRLIKQLAEMSPNSDVRPESMQMMFMGCDETAARAARDRLAAAVEQMLELPTACLGHRRKMQPAAKRFVGSFDASAGQPLAVLIEFINDLGRAIDENTPTSEPAEPATAQPCKDWLDQEIDRLFEDGHADHVDDQADTDQLMMDTTDDSASDMIHQSVPDDLDDLNAPDQFEDAGDPSAKSQNRHSDPDQSPQPGQSPKAPPSPEPQAQMSDAPQTDDRTANQTFQAAEPPDTVPAEDEPAAELDLSEYVLGVVELAAGCPSDPSTQLALDTTGRLHLLLDARGIGAPQALMRLGAVSRWAVEHASLLALTCDEMTYDTDARPIRHLFTDKPRDYARWAHAGPGGIADFHLHLLSEVVIGQSRTLHHVPVT